MKRVCAWCKKKLSGSIHDGNELISHGICETCRTLIDMNEIPINTLIDQFSFPILIVDDNNKILNSNQKASKLLNNFNLGIENPKVGQILECANSKLPEGCGKTKHCSSCVIRNAIVSTSNNGNSVNNMESSLIQHTDDGGFRRIPISISTQKIGGGIFLRIDKFKPNKRKKKNS